jgi:outer membrane immunogenic protein
MTSKGLNYLLLSLLLGSHPAISGTTGSLIETSDCSNARDNFYFGAGIGGTLNHHNYSLVNTDTGLVLNLKPRHNRLIGNVFAGYGYTTNNNLYLGGELGTNFPRRTTRFTRPGVSLTSQTFTDYLSIQDQVSWDVLLGYRLRPYFLAYARLGMAYSSIHFHQDAVINAPRFDSSSNQLGGRLGGGINVNLTSNFSMGVDYTYMDYQILPVLYPGYTIDSNSKSNTQYVAFSVIYTLPC